MKHVVRNLMAVAVAAALALGLLAGFGQAAAQDKVTITFWNGFTGPDRPAVEELVKQFNESHDNIQVEMTISPWDSLMQSLIGAMPAGEGPDVAGIHFQYVPQYAESGLIMDLTAYLAEGSDLDPANWPAALVELLQYDGKFYAAPVNFATLMLYYNKDLFAAAGLDPENPPANWDEWIEAIKATTQDNRYGIALAERQTIPMWPILIWGNGGDIIADGESMLADPKTIEALELWGSLVRDEGIAPIGLTGAEADQLFQSGRAAMEMNGPWMVNGYLEAGVNFDVAPIPEGPAGPVTLADTVVFVVNDQSENKDAVLEFIRFWNSRESQLYWSQQTGFPPARLDLADDPALLEASPWAAKFAAVVPYSRFFLGGQKDYVQIENDIFVPMIQSITQGVSSVEEAATQAHEQLTALLEGE